MDKHVIINTDKSSDLEELRVPQSPTKINDKIYIANTIDAHDPSLLAHLGINSIFSLDNSHKGALPADFNVKRIENYLLIDGPGNDYGAIKYMLLTLDNLVKNHPPVMINCNAGRSRAVSFAAAYMSFQTGKDIAQTLQEIQQVRSTAVQPALITTMRMAVAAIKE